MTEFYARFDSLRRERGKTLQQISEDTGIAPTTIMNLKEINRSHVNLIKLADYLDVSTDYLLGRTENYLSHKQLSSAHTKVIQAVMQYDLDQKSTDAVVKLIESLGNDTRNSD